VWILYTSFSSKQLSEIKTNLSPKFIYYYNGIALKIIPSQMCHLHLAFMPELVCKCTYLVWKYSIQMPYSI
jgi:hypothetical protein